MKQQVINKAFTFSCDQCGVKEEHSTPKPNGWFIFSESVSDGLRLLEKSVDEKRYESFNIPNKVEKTYCSRACALKSVTSTMELFLAEVAPKARSGSPRELIK